MTDDIFFDQLEAELQPRQKVFCQDCEFFESDTYRCRHPKSRRVEIVVMDNAPWREPARKIQREQWLLAGQRNAENTCDDYEEAQSIFWRNMRYGHRAWTMPLVHLVIILGVWWLLLFFLSF